MSRRLCPEKISIKQLFTVKKIILIFLFPIMLILNWLSSLFPEITEKYYSSLIYPVISLIINKITSIYPYSLMEIIIAAIIVLFIVLLVKLCKNIKSGQIRAYYLKRFLINTACVLSCIYTAFCFLCGFNYNRLTFSELAGLKTQPTSVQTLYDMCVSLADEAADVRERLNQEGKVFTLSGSMREAALKSADYYDALNDKYSFLTKGYTGPKPVICSEIMSYLDITGVIFPYTMEANVNTASPDFLIPSTMCHELTHVRGFMREDEANFIAYLVCRNSDNLEFEYSGLMLALIYSANALYSSDSELYYTLVKEHYSEEMLIDLKDNSEYWAKHEGFLSDVSSAVNNSYLKINNQTDGVKSYGRMVDLLIAEYLDVNGEY